MMTRNFVLIISLISFLFLNTFFINNSKKDGDKTCSVTIGLKDDYHGTVHALACSDNDEQYSISDFGWDAPFGCTIDATSDITISIKFNVSHPSGSFSLLDADNAAVLQCQNFSSGSGGIYWITFTPACNKNYIVQLSDNPC